MQALEHIIPYIKRKLFPKVNREKTEISYAGILANSRKGCWRIASSPILHAAFSNKRLEKAGFQYFLSYYKSVTA